MQIIGTDQYVDWTGDKLESFRRAFQSVTTNEAPPMDMLRIYPLVDQQSVYVTAYLNGCSQGGVLLPLQILQAISLEMQRNRV